MTDMFSIHNSLVCPLRKKLRVHFLSNMLHWKRYLRKVLGHLEVSKSNIVHSVKEGKLDPAMTLVLTPVSVIMHATIHLLNLCRQANKKNGFS